MKYFEVKTNKYKNNDDENNVDTNIYIIYIRSLISSIPILY